MPRRAAARRHPFPALAALLAAVLLLAPTLHAQTLVLDAAASAVVVDVETSSVAWGDYTGDGMLDLVVTGRDVSFQPYGLVYRNDGAGGLVLDAAASAVVADVSNSAVAWGDYTGDGWLDLVVTGRDAASNLFGLVYRNDGAGGLELDAAASAVVIDVLGGAVAWGDYTGDGMLDLVVTGQDNLSNRFGEVYRNDGSGGLVRDDAASAVVPDVTFSSVAWGDYTGDGALDLVVTGTAASGFVGQVFRNDGSGGLVLDAAASAVVIDVLGGAVAWGDYTGDGALDLIVVASQGGGVYRNDGSGGLALDAAASAVVPALAGSTAAWGDYTGDGALDLIVSGLSNSGYIAQVYRNDGSGGLALDAAASAAVGDVGLGSVAWGDYTGDGWLDLVVTGRDDSRNLFGQVYRNVQNRPPVADAGADQPVECDGRTEVTLDGSGSSDPDGDALAYSWADADGAEIATGPTPTVTLALGTHTVTLTVTDPLGESDADEVVVTVQDTEAPELTVSAAPLVLTRPNHKYVTVSLADLGLAAADACDGPVEPGEVYVASASSDEPENAGEDGNTLDDIVVDDCQTVRVRAERDGLGNGRVYTLTLAVADAAGNVGTATYEVQVPLSSNGDPAEKDGDGAAYTVDGCGAALALADEGTVASSEASASRGSEGGAPEAFALQAAYPNPFAASATIAFDVPETADVRLVVYDVLGRAVAVLADGPFEAARHAVALDGRDLPAGTYLVRMTTEGASGAAFVQTQRLTLVR